MGCRSFCVYCIALTLPLPLGFPGLPTLVLPAANQAPLFCQAYLRNAPEQDKQVYGERHSDGVQLRAQQPRTVSSVEDV